MVKFKVEDTTFNKIYPIGSIYMSINEIDPSGLFGGEWEQIEDKFLLACGTKHPNGEIDGSEDAIVVSHTHTQASHTHTTTNNYVGVGNDVNWAYGNKVQMSYTSGDRYYPHSDKNTGGITEPNTMTSIAPTINSNGVSGTGKNMPPFLAVYMWVRIA